jgi:hypothetical protein
VAQLDFNPKHVETAGQLGLGETNDDEFQVKQIWLA